MLPEHTKKNVAATISAFKVQLHNSLYWKTSTHLNICPRYAIGITLLEKSHQISIPGLYLTHKRWRGIAWYLVWGTRYKLNPHRLSNVVYFLLKN
jgi:hypothetical protein